MTDTIAAISTPFGEGAIAVLRLSGPRAVEIARGVFSGKKELAARVAHLGAIHDDGRKLDEVLLTVFSAPASYTGEDVVEIACHGGVLISRRILELLLRRGVDVLTAQDAGATRLLDPALLDRAAELGRIVFTRDSDFLAEGVRGQRAGLPFATIVHAHQQHVPSVGA